MRLFLDECLSPAIAGAINRQGVHLAMHPRDFGGLGQPDHAVLQRCLDEDLVLVTANARDFRALVASKDVHPGLIILPCLDRRESGTLLRAAIRYLSELGDPTQVMVNHVLEVSTSTEIALFQLTRKPD
ncbi:MAG: DUF5615 family PIN-like protein [Alphaproteobacteria bacterium]|nr:DUF5615 family PIN-like protein [Alphaproteobacteria bacterium]